MRIESLVHADFNIIYKNRKSYVVPKQMAKKMVKNGKIWIKESLHTYFFVLNHHTIQLPLSTSNDTVQLRETVLTVATSPANNTSRSVTSSLFPIVFPRIDSWCDIFVGLNMLVSITINNTHKDVMV